MDEQKSLLEKLQSFSEEMEGVEIIKATKAYGYYYATLNDIMETISPVLKKHGIWFYHKNNYVESLNCNTLETVVYSIGNTSDRMTSRTLIDKDAVLAKMNKFMVEGSAITYFRRYHLTTMLGLFTDEDTDAAGKVPSNQSTTTRAPQGRSVEAASASDAKPNFVEIFKGFIEKKNEASIKKMFELYKAQMDDAQIKEVESLIKAKHG